MGKGLGALKYSPSFAKIVGISAWQNPIIEIRNTTLKDKFIVCDFSKQDGKQIWISIGCVYKESPPWQRLRSIKEFDLTLWSSVGLVLST